MSKRVIISPYLDIDLDEEMWICSVCGHKIISARQNYKTGCLVYERNPAEVHPPILDGEYNFSYDPNWIVIVEYYCPGCGTQIETEYLPPGHPLTWDTEIDIDSLKERIDKGEYVLTPERRLRWLKK